MKSLKYTIIKTDKQYEKYCNILEELVFQSDDSLSEEIELLTLLIEKWDEKHDSFKDLDPVQLIKALMNEHNLKSKDLVKIIGATKGTVSKILNYHKGLSKDTIRKLSEYFKVSQEVFNKPYRLKNGKSVEFLSGDLLHFFEEGNFEYIAHGCNCRKQMGAGIAYSIAEKYPSAANADRDEQSNPQKRLGNYTIAKPWANKNRFVVNLYTQLEPGPCFDEIAFRSSLKKFKEDFPPGRIGLPRIGCGIGGGDWDRVEKIILEELWDFKITIVNFEI